MSTPLGEFGRFALTEGVAGALFNSHTVENISRRNSRKMEEPGNTS